MTYIRVYHDGYIYTNRYNPAERTSTASTPTNRENTMYSVMYEDRETSVTTSSKAGPTMREGFTDRAWYEPWED